MKKNKRIIISIIEFIIIMYIFVSNSEHLLGSLIFGLIIFGVVFYFSKKLGSDFKYTLIYNTNNKKNKVKKKRIKTKWF